MNLETLKKINYLLLRKSENIYSSSLFRTDLDLYSLSMLKVNKLYIKKFKETINYIMGVEKIYLDDTLNFIETFGSNHTNSNINAIKNEPINIKNIIDKNIKSLENLKFNNDEEKEKIIKLFKSFNYKEIYELEEYKKISKIILDHISFKNKLFDLTNEEADLKEIKKYILNNYSDIEKEFEDLYFSLSIKLLKIDDKFQKLSQEVFEELIKNRNGFSNLSALVYHDIKYKNDFKALEEFSDSYLNLEGVGNFKGIHSFSDGSLLVVNNDNTYETLFTTKSTFDFKNKVMSIYLREKYNKNPHICKDFIDISLNYNRYKAEPLIELFDKYLKNIDIFKNFNFNLAEFIKNSKEIFYSNRIEKAEDKLTELIIQHKVNQTIKNISSSKNISLFNEESFNLIKSIINEKISTKTLENYIGKKIAKFKSSEELNSSLEQFLNLFTFGYEGILNKANELNIKIVNSKNNILILEINNFEDSKIFGSPSWCISTSKHYFESYTSDENKQYFVFDFNKEITSNYSMIGITLDKNGKFNTAHLKDDEYIDEKTSDIKNILSMIKEEYKKKLKNSI